MSRVRDYFYAEDDAVTTIDGYASEHVALNILDFASTDPTFDVSQGEYVHFMNIQCGKDGGGAAIPKVELWEYYYYGSQFFTLYEYAHTDTYYSFPCVVTDDSFGGISGTETFPIYLTILSGGTT